MPRAVLLLTFCLTVAFPALARRRAAIQPPPPSGPCTEVRGLANVFLSRDGGSTFTTNREPAVPGFSWGFAALDDDPQTIVTVVGVNVYESADGGCSWQFKHKIAETIHHPLHIEPSSAGRAYFWTEEFALRYDRGTVTPIALPETIGGLGVDPANREHLRAPGLTGLSVWESFDGGASWARLANGAGGFLVAVAFDPSDFNHIVVGVMGQGVFGTRNAGRSWIASPDLSRTTVCDGWFVDRQPNVLWMTISTRPASPFVYRSTDGGSRFEPIAGITGLESGICVAFTPNPHDANVGLVTFGGRLYTFDAARKTVTDTSCCAGAAVGRIAYSPSDPNVVYVYATPQ